MQQGKKRTSAVSRKSKAKKGKHEEKNLAPIEAVPEESSPPEELGEVPPESPERPQDAAQEPLEPEPRKTRVCKPQDLEARTIQREAQQRRAAGSLEILLKTPDMDDCRPFRNSEIKVAGLDKLILGNIIDSVLRATPLPFEYNCVGTLLQGQLL